MALTLVQPNSKELFYSSNALYSSLECFGNVARFTIPARSIIRSSTVGRKLGIGSLMRSLPDELAKCCYGEELDDVGRMTGLFPTISGYTWSAPADDGTCHENCLGGDI